MRVFDFEGMLDAVSEVRETLEQQGASTSGVRPERVGSGLPDTPRQSIADSQADDEDADLLLRSEDEEVEPGHKLPAKSEDADLDGEGSRAPDYSMLIINDLTNVISPLLRNNYAQGECSPYPPSTLQFH